MSEVKPSLHQGSKVSPVSWTLREKEEQGRPWLICVRPEASWTSVVTGAVPGLTGGGDSNWDWLWFRGARTMGCGGGRSGDLGISAEAGAPENLAAKLDGPLNNVTTSLGSMASGW